jgi:hypothetical protein
MRTFPFVAAALLVGCASESETASTTHHPPPYTGPTYHEDVEPLLQDRCLNCHAEGGVAPVSFGSYEHAKLLAPAIAIETEARRMPPWGALPTDGCKTPRPYADDPHLTADQIEMLRAWSAAGAPRGEPAAAPPPYRSERRGLARVDMELAPRAPFQPEEGADAFRCFVLDPELAADAWVQGYDVIPGDRDIVHHALLFTDPERESLTLADETGSYECFGSALLADTSLLGAWAPGAEAVELPDDVGTVLRASTLIVMQVHYHPRPDAKPGADRTKLALRFNDRRPARALLNVLVGNADAPWPGGDGLLPGDGDRNGKVEFRIPANAEAHLERMRFTVNLPIPDVLVYGAGAHMHRAGKNLKIEQIHTDDEGNDGDRTCLLETPAYDYNWQRLYRYDAAIDDLPKLASGDVLEVSCTYDNSMGNAAVAEQLREQHLTKPQDVFLGETTLDEMCVGFVPVIHPNF